MLIVVIINRADGTAADKSYPGGKTKCKILRIGKEDNMDNIKQMKDDHSDLNYDTIIDTYLPSVPKVTTDQPLRPQDPLDVYELKQEYKKICEREFKF